MIAPSVTPRKSNIGSNNPAMRLYKFETDTGQVSLHVLYINWTLLLVRKSSLNIQSVSIWVLVVVHLVCYIFLSLAPCQADIFHAHINFNKIGFKIERRKSFFSLSLILNHTMQWKDFLYKIIWFTTLSSFKFLFFTENEIQ